MTQQTQQTQQPPPIMGGADHDRRLGVLEAEFKGFSAQLTRIAEKLEARTKIDWAPIGILVAVLGSVGGMGFTWINTGQGRLETLIAKIEARSERYVPREDLDTRFTGLQGAVTDRFAVVAQRRDDLQKLTDERLARIERDIDAVQKQVVPRGEHEQTWATQRARDEGLQRQLDQARRDLSELNTPRDTIQGMLRRLDDLDRAVRANARSAP